VHGVSPVYMNESFRSHKTKMRYGKSGLAVHKPPPFFARNYSGRQTNVAHGGIMALRLDGIIKPPSLKVEKANIPPTGGSLSSLREAQLCRKEWGRSPTKQTNAKLGTWLFFMQGGS
jgi:hypothetical protein